MAPKKVRKRATPPGTKWCTRGEHFVPVEEMAKNRSRPDGLADMCRVCFRDYFRLRRTGTTAPRYPEAPPGQKWCRHNNHFADVSQFTRKPLASDGLEGWCKFCKNAYVRLHYPQKPMNPADRKRKPRRMKPYDLEEAPPGQKWCIAGAHFVDI